MHQTTHSVGVARGRFGEDQVTLGEDMRLVKQQAGALLLLIALLKFGRCSSGVLRLLVRTSQAYLLSLLWVAVWAPISC